jgi:ribosomal protein S18 acetylase RimI-like enzyme
VHPDFARQGLAKTLIEKCESEAKKSGFSKIELMSTLPGIKFYRTQGYLGEKMVEYVMPNGIAVQLLPMAKSLI